MQAKNTSRNYSLDLIRVFAFFCVVSIHFFLHTGYNFVVIQGGRMYVSTLIQSVFPICVPLFLILSGYLQKKKTPSRHYYKRLLPILAEYLAASICCTVYRALSQGCPEGIFPFLLQELLGIFAYTTAPYGWYIEMFIGLFLLIPYLNILYSQLADRRRKQMLLLTLLVLTSLPSLTNTFSLTAGDTLYQIRLLPQWWTGFYPVTYYYIGAYLSEYPLQLKKKSLFLIILSASFLSGSLSFVQWHGTINNWSTWQSYGSVVTVFLSVLIFSFLSQISIQPGTLPAKVLPRLSDLCFCAYLVSYIFDDLIYNHSGLFSDASTYRIEYYGICVPAVFLCSLLLSAVIRACLTIPSRLRKGRNKEASSQIP